MDADNFNYVMDLRDRVVEQQKEIEYLKKKLSDAIDYIAKIEYLMNDEVLEE